SIATAPSVTSTLSLHDALPIYCPNGELAKSRRGRASLSNLVVKLIDPILECFPYSSIPHCKSYGIYCHGVAMLGFSLDTLLRRIDRKSTRLNSSHVSISYAVFC